jgi:NCAIR mutase (PurE)-related protein
VRRSRHDISHDTNQQSSHSTISNTTPDLDRRLRTGIPEFVLAATKPAEEVMDLLLRLADADGRALATRCPQPTIARIHERLSGSYELVIDEEARVVVVAQPGCQRPRTGGQIGILTAGSSDGPVAAEAAVVAREMGVEVVQARDVGVAGLHRLVAPLEGIVASGVDVLVVVAGMDGALPSVVAGLVDVPVIGVPTSTGYGYGGEGVGALMAMLQSCAPGLVVVNIDNGVGAGATAALIANRMAAVRAVQR